MTDTQTTPARKEKHKGMGHRQRLRERFLQGGLNAFLDYEIVELLLTLGTPRRDCKDIAKEAIKKFGGLRQVLDAATSDLQEIKGVGPSNIFGVKLFQAVSERYAKEKLDEKVAFTSPKSVADYLQKRIGKAKKEHFVMLYLDSRNRLTVEEVSVGTLNASLVHPREVFNQAIRSHAAQVIIAHNHPSGDSEPSPEDVALTRRLDDASKIIGIELIDHVIVTTDSFSSMKEKGMF